MPHRQRPARSFRNGRNPAVGIPVELELSGSEAIMRREDDAPVIVPVRWRDLKALLDSWEPLDEELPQIVDRPPEPEELF